MMQAFDFSLPFSSFLNNALNSVPSTVALGNINCLQQLGKSSPFQGSVKMRAAINVMLVHGAIQFGSTSVPIIQSGIHVMQASILCQPVFVTDGGRLASSSQKIPLSHPSHIPGLPRYPDGTQRLTVSMIDRISFTNYLRVDSKHAIFDCLSFRYVCRRCSEEGNVCAQCKTDYFTLCFIFNSTASLWSAD